MSYKESEDYRIVADIGSWNFRFSKVPPNGLNRHIHAYKSRIGKAGKMGHTKLISEADARSGFIDEVDTKFQNIFTKSVITNFGLLDVLFEQILKTYSIINEKR
jgi:hypothetical protein